MADQGKCNRVVVAAALAAIAVMPSWVRAGSSTNSKTPVATFPGMNDSGGSHNPAVTISLSGSTAMRNFTVSSGITFLTPGSPLSFNNGAIVNPAAPVHLQTRAPVLYSVDDQVGTQFQLASPNFTQGDFYKTGTGNPEINGPWPQTAQPIQQHSAIRFEWHEQGSVEGILELVNDQIGVLGSVTATNRNPSGTGFTPVWINTTQWSAASAVNRPQSATATNGHVLNEFYATAGATSGLAVFDNRDGIGVNPNGGQNAIQMAISDVNARQGFSKSGANGAFSKAPGMDGFGKGNPALGSNALKISGVGIAGARQALEDQEELNMTTSMRNLRTGPSSNSPLNVDGAANHTAGPWNTAGVGNLHNTTIAITATLIAANPGTGLERINRTDGQWLQAVGRLKNGADFNVATRDANSGTRNVAALNLGLDPSFAMGELDNGNNGSTSSAENLIGPGIKFSGKLSGGSALRPTIQNSRMSLGHLSISDAIGSTNNGSNAPLRGLDIANVDDSVASPTFVRAGAENIVNGTYPLFQNQTYVTVKKPGASFTGDSVATWSARTDAETGILGDNSGNDVRDFRDNITNSVAQFPQSTDETPADQLIRTSFIIPQLMRAEKDVDGGAVTVNSQTPQQEALTTAFLGDANLTSRFAVGGNITGALGKQVDVDTGNGTNKPSTVTAGSSSFYGSRTGTGQIAITSNNYLFGDFNKTAVNSSGVRDFSDLNHARLAQSALGASGLGNSMFSTGTTLNANNGTLLDGSAGVNLQTTPAALGFTASKGDLIVMGDFDSDGDFDGEDLRRMARGTALADNTSSTTLSGGAAAFGDKVRSGVLRKNAALDQLNSGGLAASTLQKQQAIAKVTTPTGTAAPGGSTVLSTTGSGPTLVQTYTFDDANGTNAFNKFDVNRDGKVSKLDAQLVDNFVTKDYRNLDNQLDAVARVSATGQLTAFVDDFGNPLDPKSSSNDLINRVPISLVDVELNDTGDITNTGDFKLVRDALGNAGLLDGDANFDGKVDFSDFQRLEAKFGQAGKWLEGDFDSNGLVNFTDYQLLEAKFGQNIGAGAVGFTPDQWAYMQAFEAAAVPEPTSLCVAGIAGLGLLGRRRRR